jgi:hypothetical protein
VLLVLRIAFATPALSAAHDLASLRTAVDDFVAKEKPGFQRLRGELTGSHPRGSLPIHASEFHYFGPLETRTHRIPGVTTRLGDRQMLRLVVRPVEGAQAPKIEAEPSTIALDEGAWHMVPVPQHIVSPEEAMRQLNRDLPGDPYRRPRAGVPMDRNRRELFERKRVQSGDARAASAREQFRWTGLSAACGFRRHQAECFAKTRPLGQWIWWTMVEQDRPAPASAPRRAGTPRRVLESVYIDAITGEAQSHCHGADAKPIRCEVTPNRESPGGRFSIPLANHAASAHRAT